MSSTAKTKYLKRMKAIETPIPLKPSHYVESHLTVRFTGDMGWRFSLSIRYAGLDQTETARLLGVTQGYISKVFTGKIEHSRIEYLRLKSIFGPRRDKLFRFIFQGPPKENWLKFQLITDQRAMGERIPPPGEELTNGYVWL